LACQQQEHEITAEINSCHCQRCRDRSELADYKNT